jgi:hypothetical protein
VPLPLAQEFDGVLGQPLRAAPGDLGLLAADALRVPRHHQGGASGLKSEHDLEQQDYEFDDPNDPRHPDFDLSESAPYDFDGPYEKPWFLRRGVLLLVSALLIISLLLPFAFRV